MILFSLWCSDNEGNNSEYEDDDFLVADDAPIETYEPSQDELDDGLEESDGDKDKEEDDNEGLFGIVTLLVTLV